MMIAAVLGFWILGGFSRKVRGTWCVSVKMVSLGTGAQAKMGQPGNRWIATVRCGLCREIHSRMVRWSVHFEKDRTYAFLDVFGVSLVSGKIAFANIPFLGSILKPLLLWNSSFAMTHHPCADFGSRHRFNAETCWNSQQECAAFAFWWWKVSFLVVFFEICCRQPATSCVGCSNRAPPRSVNVAKP